MDKPLGKKLRNSRCGLKAVHTVSTICHLLYIYTHMLNDQSASTEATIRHEPLWRQFTGNLGLLEPQHIHYFGPNGTSVHPVTWRSRGRLKVVTYELELDVGGITKWDSNQVVKAWFQMGSRPNIGELRAPVKRCVSAQDPDDGRHPQIYHAPIGWSYKLEGPIMWQGLLECWEKCGGNGRDLHGKYI